MKQLEKNVACVGGIRFFGGDRQEGMREIAARLADGRQTAVYTPNSILLENAARDASFRAVLARADLNLPDGMGVVVAARLLGEEISERLSGVDMARRVLFLASKKGYRVFFLGGREGVPLKPDPTVLLEVIRSLGFQPSECAYIGDSDVDMLTARNAGASLAIGVSWGYRSRELLVDSGADCIADTAPDISRLIFTKNT